jgi:exopolysaccharide biosynthesis protein
MAENMKASTFVDEQGNTVEIVDAQAVRITPQTLTEEQKAQVRMNIGLDSGGGGSAGGANETLTLDIRKGKYWGNSQGMLEQQSAPTRDSTTFLCYDREVTITPVPPAKFAYYTLEADLKTIITDSGWKIEQITIPPNTNFVLNFQYREQDLTEFDTLSNYIIKIAVDENTADAITTDDIENEFGYDDKKVMSQKAITEMFSQFTPVPLLNAINNSMRLGTQWSASVGNVAKQTNSVAYRGSCDWYIFAPYPIEMIANTGFNFALVYLDDDNVVVEDIGWKTQYTIPANQRFVFSLECKSKEAFTEETILQAVVISPIIINENDVSQSLYVEYGRIDGATYNFVRIPKVSNDGATIKPVVALTSDDGSLNGGKCSPLTYSKKNNLQFTINAGLFDMSAMVPVGQTIIDGVSITNTPMADDNGVPISDTECYPLCIDAEGNLSAPYDRHIDTAAMIADGVKYAITGWGKLVDNFVIAQSEIDAEIVHKNKKYSRQCIGQFENGDYCVLTAWGGSYDTNYQNEAGLSYEECARILVEHGVKFAYSLDGGGSAATVIKRRQISPIYQGISGRNVPSVIYFTAE